MAGYFVNERPYIIDLLNTPHQVGEWMSRTPNLRIIVEKASFPLGLMNTSASWFVEVTYLVTTEPSCILSWIKWQSISICLVLSWKRGLAAICKVAVLSQYNNVGFRCNILKCVNNECCKVNSKHVPIMALYPAFAEERDTIFYLFVRYEIREDPQKNTVTRSGSMRYWTTSPNQIRKSSQR